MQDISIQVKELSKRFDKRVILSDISFTHKKGILGIAGSNGSGKSTLMKCIAGLWRPSKGEVFWKIDDTEIEHQTFKNILGYAAPYINLYDELTCYENLNFLLKFKQVDDIAHRIREALKQTDILDLSGQPYQNLSTGQQQRMRISAALIHQPEVLLFDEPGSNLDKAGHKTVAAIVNKFKASGRLVIVASNDEKELNLCDRIFSIEKERFDEG